MNYGTLLPRRPYRAVGTEDEENRLGQWCLTSLNIAKMISDENGLVEGLSTGSSKSWHLCLSVPESVFFANAVLLHEQNMLLLKFCEEASES